jgi:triosephosphate isomerase
MNKCLIVANWKMNLNTEQASLYIHKLDKVIEPHRSVEVIIAPSTLVLQPLSLQLDRHKYKLAAQNAYFKDQGPYTGEVSFTMLRDLVSYVIIGHSERRIYFHETLEEVRDKMAASIRNGIKPILCIGESKPEKLAGETKKVIHDQIVSALANLTSDEVREVAIAYEPIWAISTFGHEPAKPADIQKAFDYIRYQISELYGEATAKAVRVLYGGSVDTHTVSGYLALDGCNGALVGADSLHYNDFAEIVSKAYAIESSKK